MGNIKQWLLRAEDGHGERIEAIVLGTHYNDDSKWDSGRTVPPDEQAVLSREAGLAKLDQDFDSGFGGEDCYPMYAWSKSWVYLIACYDGSTWLTAIPRNPTECEPRFVGGS